MEELSIAIINLLTWFLMPFAHFLMIYFFISLFRRD